eukprot:8546684-Prorocentrum_lima.AAC.1
MDITAKTPTHTYYLDVSVVDPLTATANPSGPPTLRPRPSPLHTREQEKLRKYAPHPNFIPF